MTETIRMEETNRIEEILLNLDFSSPNRDIDSYLQARRNQYFSDVLSSVEPYANAHGQREEEACPYDLQLCIAISLKRIADSLESMTGRDRT